VLLREVIAESLGEVERQASAQKALPLPRRESTDRFGQRLEIAGDHAELPAFVRIGGLQEGRVEC
jgi:hypothetical protein